MDTNHSSISPERWNQISSILQQLMDVDRSEQFSLLDQLCGPDETLRKEVLAFFKAHEEAGGYLTALDGKRAQLLLQDNATLKQVIGPYRTIKELGRGGMGVVYLAERIDGQYEQQVALKLIKRGMDSDAIERRFLHERQILARLQHPNIARLLDGNITKAGQPYFAMEYIDGSSILAYCDQKKATIEDRLVLFGEVTKAVQYAHANLVVHRDLKPSNMLVDGNGQIKLLDFGIAKVLSGEQAQPLTSLTQTGARVMTPEYASPEQIEGKPITTATDVYALGVVLYELLSGIRPVEFDSRAPVVMAKTIKEHTPLAPSSSISKSTSHTAYAAQPVSHDQISKLRSTTPDKLRKRLSGDLDRIVLKALHKDPERRYRSIEALGEDLRRHIAGLPVSAQRDSMLYRFSKFARRHLAVVIAAMLILVSLSAGFSATLWQAARANRERDVAKLETEKAKQVASFMAALFQTSDPAISRGNEITVREMLDSGAVRIDRELENQPEVRAQMMDAIGRAYFGLGLYDQAHPMLEQSLMTREAISGVNESDIAESHYNLAYLLSRQGYYEEAESHYRSSLDIRRTLPQSNPQGLIKSTNGLAFVLRSSGQFAASEVLYLEALNLARIHLQRKDPELSISLNGLAASFRSQGKLSEAKPIFREALELVTEIHGENHPDVAISLYNLAALLHETEEYEEAKPLYEKTLEIDSRLVGDKHPTIAIDLSGLARLYFDLGDYQGAEASYNKALKIQREVLQMKHSRIATTLVGLSKVYIATNRSSDALDMLQEALLIRKEAFVATHWLIGEAMSTIGLCYAKLNEPILAEKYLIDGFELLNNARGQSDPYTQTALNYLIDFYEDGNQQEKAEHYLQQRDES